MLPEQVLSLTRRLQFQEHPSKNFRRPCEVSLLQRASSRPSKSLYMALETSSVRFVSVLSGSGSITYRGCSWF